MKIGKPLPWRKDAINAPVAGVDADEDCCMRFLLPCKRESRRAAIQAGFADERGVDWGVI